MSDDNQSGAVPKVDRNPIRLGYVGCGFMAQNVHLPNFSSLSDCRLVALAENRADLGRQVAQRYSIPKVYREHRDLLDESEIDAAAVSADYAQQGEIAADLLRAGKHVFMEKPMAVSVEQARRILQAEREGKARLMVAYMKRYDPGNRAVRQTVREWKQNRSKGKLLFARNHRVLRELARRIGHLANDPQPGALEAGLFRQFITEVDSGGSSSGLRSVSPAIHPQRQSLTVYFGHKPPRPG